MKRRGIDWTTVRRTLEQWQNTLGQSCEIDAARLQAIYAQRAIQLAQRGEIQRTVTVSVLTFSLGAEHYGIELTELAEVRPLIRCTRMPGAPHEMVGFMNLGGVSWSVFDLARLLGIAADSDSYSGYVLLLRVRGRRLGFRVDGLEGIRTAAADEIAGPAGEGSALPTEYIRGFIASGPVILLDTAAIRNHPSLQETV